MLDTMYFFLIQYEPQNGCIFYLIIGFRGMIGEDLKRNNVKTYREKMLMSKAELARKAGVSPLTIDRIEKGKDCRMDTKRKILFALGLDLAEKDKVFASYPE